MNNEIKEILDNMLHIICTKCNYQEEVNHQLSYKEIKTLLDYITNLQEKVDQYENPDDLTLFYMWLDEKTKDKIKQLQEENKRIQDRNIELVLERDRLKEELQQEKKDFKEANDYCFELKDYKSRNKKAIEYIKDSNILAIYKLDYFIEDLLNILQGEDYNKVERAYLDDEWIGEDKDVKDKR